MRIYGRGLVPMRQCRWCGDFFDVLETAQHFPDYCPGKDCGVEARRARKRAEHERNKLSRKLRACTRSEAA